MYYILNLECVVYHTKSVAERCQLSIGVRMGTHCLNINVVAYGQRYHDILTLTISIMHYIMHTQAGGKAGKKWKWEQVR